MSRLLLSLSLVLGILGSFTTPVHAARPQSAANAVESTQRQSETQVRALIEPLLEKYCHDECKLMSVTASVDVAVPDEVSPGFDDMDPQAASRLAPSSARIKVLMDDKVGPVSRRKLLDLVQQYLDTLDYPVKVEVQLAHFPQPQGASGKVAELREGLSKKFKDRLDALFAQFCPDHCLFADFNLQTETVNSEEAQYGQPGEFLEDGGVAIRVKGISGTILVDDILTPEEAANIGEMARLRTNDFRNVTLTTKALKFPRPIADSPADRTLSSRDPRYAGPAGRSLASEQKTTENSQSSTDSRLVQNHQDTSRSDSTSQQRLNSQSQSQTNVSDQREERFSRTEKIERVESGDAVQQELRVFRTYALIFGLVLLTILVFVAFAVLSPKGAQMNPLAGLFRDRDEDAPADEPASSSRAASWSGDRVKLVAMRYEIERLTEELFRIFSEQPKVAKQVFTRILTEEGVETTSSYIQIFGESVVMDMLRDPTLQADLNELMEYHAKNPVDLKDEEKYELLRRLHNRAIAAKMVVLGSRTSAQFDFLADMDGSQILELVRNESLTVKAIILTQCEQQKRSSIYSQLDEESRMKIMAELGRIDHLPRDYIANVASALRRKRLDTPRLNTEALPGSEVLITLLERAPSDMQSALMRNLERTNPDSARTVKSKLVSVNTLRYLQDNQILEVVLSLKHDELVQFLKATPDAVRTAVLSKAPSDLSGELSEEIAATKSVSRETYQNIERKVLNRMKIMVNEGLINLSDTNDRIFFMPGREGTGDATRVLPRGA